MFKKFFTTLAFSLFLIPQAFAMHDDVCVPAATVLNSVTASISDATISELTNEQVKMFMYNYNAEPPASDFVADKVYTVTSPTYPDIVFGVVENRGCVVIRGNLPKADFLRLLGEKEAGN